MRRARLIPLALVSALAALALTGSGARADIIDFNPKTDDAPTILTSEEMDKWAAIRTGGSRPNASQANITPDGRFAIVSAGGTKVLVTDTGEMVDLVLDAWQLQSTITWTGDTEGVVFVAKPGSPPAYAKMTLDLDTRTFETEEFTLAIPAGRRVSLRGGTLFQLPDGGFHVRGFTTPATAEVLTFEAPTFDVDGAGVQYDLKPEPFTYCSRRKPDRDHEH